MESQKAEPGHDSSPDPGANLVVTFKRSDRQVAWTEHSASLLDFAEEQGFEPPFSCRAGVCGTCSTRLLAGAVTYFEAPLDEPDDGQVLICCSKPASAVTLDL